MPTSPSRCCAALLAVLLIAAPARAADEVPKPNPDDKLHEPGPEHKILALIAGKFDAVHEVWERPADPNPKSRRHTGTLETRLIYGGRFVEGRFVDDAPGDRGTGQCLIGFDAAIRRYVGVWVNSNRTGIVRAEGTADATGKVITFDQPPEKDYHVRVVVTVTDATTHRHEVYVVVNYLPAPLLVTRITYTRAK